MTHTTQNTLLLLIGLATAVMLAKGTYLHYVKPSLLPWLIAAASVLVVLGLTAVLRDLRNAGAQHDPGETSHRHRNWLCWLLLIPVAMVAFIVPPPLDGRGATASPVAASAPALRAFPPLPPGQAPAMSLPDVVMRAAADSAHTLDGRSITLSGFTMHYPDGVYLARVVIVCCAADAQLARMRLDGPATPSAAELPEETWIKVIGQIRPGSSVPANNFIPTLTTNSVTRIDKPANTYAY